MPILLCSLGTILFSWWFSRWLQNDVDGSRLGWIFPVMFLLCLAIPMPILLRWLYPSTPFIFPVLVFISVFPGWLVTAGFAGEATRREQRVISPNAEQDGILIHLSSVEELPWFYAASYNTRYFTYGACGFSSFLCLYLHVTKKNKTQNLGLMMGSYCQSGVLEPGIHPGGEGEIDRLLLWYPITGTSGNTTKKIIMITQ